MEEIFILNQVNVIRQTIQEQNYLLHSFHDSWFVLRFNVPDRLQGRDIRSWKMMNQNISQPIKILTWPRNNFVSEICNESYLELVSGSKTK